MVVRMGIMWYAMQWFRGAQTPAGAPATMSNPLYRKGDLVDMHVYLSEDPFLASRREAELIWREKDIALASSPERLLNYTYTPSKVTFVLLQSSCSCPPLATAFLVTVVKVHMRQPMWHTVVA